MKTLKRKKKSAPGSNRNRWTAHPVDNESKLLCVVIETPKGCRNKYKYDEQQDYFELHKVLPVGSTFPYDFGFLPGTEAPDGDPIDVLLLMDESAFPGCVVAARLIGVIEAEQTEDGQTVRNDRLIAVADDAHDYRDIHSLADINDNLLKELSIFSSRITR